MKKRFFLFFFFLLMVSPFVVRGGLVPCGGPGQNPCTFCDLFKLFQNVINFVIIDIVPPVAVLVFTIAGIMFFFSGGSPSTIARAKNLFTSAVIGLALVYGAWLIVGIILEVLGIAQSTGINPSNWFIIQCPPP